MLWDGLFGLWEGWESRDEQIVPSSEEGFGGIRYVYVSAQLRFLPVYKWACPTSNFWQVLASLVSFSDNPYIFCTYALVHTKFGKPKIPIYKRAENEVGH